MPLLRSLGKPDPRSFSNIVFVCIDDLNDWVSCLLGHPNARTPHIDRLARSGMLFTDCHAAAPICNPSRTATYFGRLPSSSGIYGNEQDWRECSRLAGQESVFECFRKAGMQIYGSGKIHHKGFVRPRIWDEFWPDPRNFRPEGKFSEKEVPHKLKEVRAFRWGILPEPIHRVHPLADEGIREYAVGKLSESRTSHERFALTIGFNRPHVPMIVPERFFRMFPIEDLKLPFVYDRDLDDLGPIGRRFAKGEGDHEKITAQGLWAEAVQAYLSSIAFIDEQVGHVLDAYNAFDQRESTALVLWSDNGFHLGEKFAWKKKTLWRESTRVPLIIIAPGITEPGSICNRPVSLVSLLATICDLIGSEAPASLDGRSLLPLLENPRADWDEPVVSCLGRRNIAIRNQDWTYIEYEGGEEAELYHRSRDPREVQNLWPVARPEVLSLMKSLCPKGPVEHDPPVEDTTVWGLDDD